MVAVFWQGAAQNQADGVGFGCSAWSCPRLFESSRVKVRLEMEGDGAPSEYQRWVGEMPEQMRASLMVGDVVPTAFYQARRAGWEFDALKFDALAAVNRGGGVGVLVERFRTLAQTSPAPQRRGKGEVRVEDRVPERFTVARDPNGERLALMERARRGLSPEEAEAEMVALNERLRAEYGEEQRWRIPVMGWRS